MGLRPMIAPPSWQTSNVISVKKQHQPFPAMDAPITATTIYVQKST
jgi:hypothetical protein